MDGYWLYKPNSTWPNSGTTNFVESVRVILGGAGQDFTYKNDDTGAIENEDIGSIICF